MFIEHCIPETAPYVKKKKRQNPCSKRTFLRFDYLQTLFFKNMSFKPMKK